MADHRDVPILREPRITRGHANVDLGSARKKVTKFARYASPAGVPFFGWLAEISYAQTYMARKESVLSILFFIILYVGASILVLPLLGVGTPPEAPTSSPAPAPATPSPGDNGLSFVGVLAGLLGIVVGLRIKICSLRRQYRVKDFGLMQELLAALHASIREYVQLLTVTPGLTTEERQEARDVILWAKSVGQNRQGFLERSAKAARSPVPVGGLDFVGAATNLPAL